MFLPLNNFFLNPFYVQARQLQEDWRNLTAQQKQKEQELEIKEKELIRRREMLELERRNLLNEVRGHELMASMHNSFFILFYVDLTGMYPVARI